MKKEKLMRTKKGYLLGAYTRPTLKEYSVFDAGDDALPLAHRACSLAFGHACTGPTKIHQNAGSIYAGSIYQVRHEDGTIVFSVEVTKEGKDAMHELCRKLLRDHNDLMRGWVVNDKTGYALYCRNAKTVLGGDIRHFVEQLIIPKLELKSYCFDGDKPSWEEFLLKPKTAEKLPPSKRKIAATMT